MSIGTRRILRFGVGGGGVSLPPITEDIFYLSDPIEWTATITAGGGWRSDWYDTSHVTENILVGVVSRYPWTSCDSLDGAWKTKDVGTNTLFTNSSCHVGSERHAYGPSWFRLGESNEHLFWKDDWLNALRNSEYFDYAALYGDLLDEEGLYKDGAWDKGGFGNDAEVFADVTVIPGFVLQTNNSSEVSGTMTFHFVYYGIPPGREA